LEIINIEKEYTIQLTQKIKITFKKSLFYPEYSRTISKNCLNPFILKFVSKFSGYPPVQKLATCLIAPWERLSASTMSTFPVLSSVITKEWQNFDPIWCTHIL
jgi:hypothetical protein